MGMIPFIVSEVMFFFAFFWAFFTSSHFSSLQPIFPFTSSLGEFSEVLNAFRFSIKPDSVNRRQFVRWCSPGARVFRAPIWCPSGGSGTREAGGTVAESLVALCRVGMHQIRRGRRAARSSTSQGSAEPLCARIKGAIREVSKDKADV